MKWFRRKKKKQPILELGKPYGVRSIKITPYLRDGWSDLLPLNSFQTFSFPIDINSFLNKHHFDLNALSNNNLRLEYKTHDLHGRQIVTRHIVGKFVPEKCSQPKLCLAESEPDVGFICTLPPNHDERWHVATDLDEDNPKEFARWPVE